MLLPNNINNDIIKKYIPLYIYIIEMKYKILIFNVFIARYRKIVSK